jgi:hypothetical protein
VADLNANITQLPSLGPFSKYEVPEEKVRGKLELTWIGEVSGMWLLLLLLLVGGGGRGRVWGGSPAVVVVLVVVLGEMLLLLLLLVVVGGVWDMTDVTVVTMVMMRLAGCGGRIGGFTRPKSPEPD